MSKRKYEGEQTKKHIVDKAKCLFYQRGYAATSIQDICVASGCSKGNLYYHFKSKEDLFLYLEEHTLSEWLEQLEKIFSQCKSFTEKLYAYGDFFAGLERSLQTVEREFLTKVGVDSEAGQRLLSLLSKFSENTKKLVADGIASGELKNEDLNELTLIIMGFYTGLHRNPFFTDKEAKKAFFRKATTLLLEGISAGSKEEKST